MTTVVKKGAKRPAAAAKTAKAAQRTPLPPKQPVIEHAKAAEFSKFALDAGWEPDVTTSKDVTSVKSTRGPEVITVRWMLNAFLDAAYVCESRTIILRNVSAARKQMTVPAAKAVEANRSVAVRSLSRKAQAEDDDDEMDHRKHLPFDAETSMDHEVLAALIGKKIAWRNRLTGLVESARVLAVPVTEQKHLKIDIKNGRRILTFCDEPSAEERMQGITSGSFHSVYLDAIRRVT